MKERTSDGFLTVTALRRGRVEQQSWKDDGVTHVTLLLIVERGKEQPPMYRVNHRAYGVVENHNLLVAQQDVLFDDVRKARNLFRKLRNNPPENTIPTLLERKEL